MLAGVFLLCVLTFPETLYFRQGFPTLEKRSYWQRLALRGKVLRQTLTWHDFLGSVRMLRYVTIVIPCAYYMTANTYGSILFVLTCSSIAEKLYGFNTAQTGLLLGVPLTIGCLVGEACTGWLSDRLINRMAARNDGFRKPEVRLWLAPLALFIPIGLIIHGVAVQERAHWAVLAVGMAVTSIGTQAATTLTYAYCTDCYKPQAAEVCTVINLFRQIFAFAVGFYALPFGELAAANFLMWLPLIWLIWGGERVRAQQRDLDPRDSS
jgi:MFS family permease